MTLSLVILIGITLLMEKQADQNLVPCYRLIVIDWNISKDLKFSNTLHSTLTEVRLHDVRGMGFAQLLGSEI